MSNNLEPRVVDLGVACLVCLMEEPESSSIYTHDPESPHMLILDKIRCCTGLQLEGSPSQLQSWPDKICKQCYLELSVSYRFHEKCAAVQKLFHTASSASSSSSSQLLEQPQLKLDQLRLPATLKIKRLDLEPESQFYQDVVEEEESLLPEGAMVLSLNELQEQQQQQEQDPIRQQEETEEEEEDQELAVDPWEEENEEDNTPEHLYEIETPLMEESLPDSPPLPSPPQLKKRSSVATKKAANPDEDYKPAAGNKRRHERSPKICDVCGNTYKYQHALNAHMRRHNNERPFPCEVCQKAFISNVELRRHMRVHTGQKPYSCRYCERRFSDFGSSKKHERIHTGERPYVCEVCHKGFAYAHVLSVHRRTHTGKKQFQCGQCDKGFTKKSYLAAHMEQHRGSGAAGLPGNRRDVERKAQVPQEKFALDSAVVLEQTKVLEECIVANDFMFHEEEEENPEEEHEEPYPEPDFDDVDGYQSVRSVKELVGDLLDTEEFVDDSKYMID
ncbi:zinc finger and SCAN domain-containing protein 31 [Drosophila takahashii]|uniref:zinc finger and SCAN domain-containing protein 31 n=1 Tax=Drosophila takahashii TaxID=29030 RepID=UPI001CF85678|nr:zinc finger protein 583 [Drosophila takahashii]